MKYFPFILLFFSLTLSLRAQTYKILQMNDADVVVDGRRVRVGNTLYDKSVIRWGKERQAMKVVCLENKKMYNLVSYSLNQNNRSIADIIVRTRHLSTHDQVGKKLGFATRLRRLFESEYVLWDAIMVPTDSIEFSDVRYLSATYEYGDAKVSKRLEVRDGFIVIDRSIFYVDGQQLVPRDIQLNVEYYDDMNGTVFFVKSDISIFVVSDRLE